MIELYVGSDTDLIWDRMRDRSGNYINDATVTFAVKTLDGDAVTGASGSMNYVFGSNGLYVGVLNSTADIEAGQEYYVDMTAASGTKDGFRRLEARAVYKGRT